MGHSPLGHILWEIADASGRVEDQTLLAGRPLGDELVEADVEHLAVVGVGVGGVGVLLTVHGESLLAGAAEATAFDAV